MSLKERFLQKIKDDPYQFIKVLLFHLIFLVILLWLFTNIILFAHLSGLQSEEGFFLLSQHPGIATALFVAILFLYWAFNNNNLKNLSQSISPIFRLAFALTILFYLSLIVAGYALPHVIGRQFEDDWAFLVLAAIPLLLALLKILIDRATTIKAKMGGLEIEFQAPDFPPPDSLTLSSEELRDQPIYKAGLHELKKYVERLQGQESSSRVILVKVPDSNSRISFFALRTYVFELAQVSKLESIVFVDEQDKYLGFMSIEEWKFKYPLLGPEHFYSGFYSQGIIGFERLWERLFFEFRNHPMEVLEEIRRYVVRKYWDQSGEHSQIEQSDLERLGVRKIALQSTDSLRAYQLMVAQNLDSVPILDQQYRFLGIATKARITDQVIKRLLGE